jgi:hypothetical protein
MSSKQFHVQLTSSDQKAGYWPDTLSRGGKVFVKHYSVKGASTVGGFADDPILLIQVFPSNNLEQPLWNNGGQRGLAVPIKRASTIGINFNEQLFKVLKTTSSHDIRFKLIKPNGDLFTVFDRVDLVLEYDE